MQLGWLAAGDRRAVVAVSVFGAVLLWVRSAFAVRNLYAGDGAVPYHDALTRLDWLARDETFSSFWD